MEIQKSKKDLASLLFSPREDAQAGGVEHLEVCSSLKHWEGSSRKSLELADELIVAL